jgi:hypothetical protein
MAWSCFYSLKRLQMANQCIEVTDEKIFGFKKAGGGWFTTA